MIQEQEQLEEQPELSSSEEELFKSILEGSNDSYEAVTLFDDPVHMLYTVDSNFREGRRSLHLWQLKMNKLISKKDTYSLSNRLRLYVAACNGSGKDAYVITLTAVFLALSQKRHRVIITSSSYTQMYSQTQAYIRSLCSAENKYFAAIGLTEEVPMFIIKKDHIVCSKSGSEIKMFVTDDPGRAEGYHPFPDCSESEVTVIINEAKSVKDEIFTALKRCTYTRWIEVSSTGTMAGHFYNRFQAGEDYQEDKGKLTGRGIRYRVTWEDCPHITKEAYDEDIDEFGGEENDLIKSKYWSIFVSADACVVISQDIVNRVMDTPCEKVEKKSLNLGRRAGVDLGASADGDESCIVITDENLLIGLEAFRISNTVRVVDRLIILFEKWELEAQNIFIDDGNTGKAVVDMLHDRRWKVNRVLNQWAAINKAAYRNRGAEMWFNVEKIFDRQLIGVSKLLKDDKKLRHQLSTRYYKKSNDLGKLVLESKAESRGNGRGSPDRADALILAFSGLTYHTFLHGRRIRKKEDEAKNFLYGAGKYDVDRFIRDVRHKRRQLSSGIMAPLALPGQRATESILMPLLDGERPVNRELARKAGGKRFRTNIISVLNKFR
jgi:hypothetical protein